ncbi:MAG: ribonuclease Z [Candidatus Woesearchaeota archaeon]
MEITFLGTSCMVPTKERNVSGIFLSYNTEGILFDCGEGTQRQMNICGIKRTRVTKILVSHWHGDHVSGIVGLLQTLGNEENLPELEVYGPKGTREYMKHLMKSCQFDVQVKLKIVELMPKGVETFFENEEFELQCAQLDHNATCIGFSFVEKDRRKINVAYLKSIKVPTGAHLRQLQAGKSITFKGIKVHLEKATTLVKGKKITYVADTAPCANAVKLAKDADLLISESVYTSELEEKSEQRKHMTSKDAAQMADKAGAKKLILTHFSQRYKNTIALQEDAQNYFDNVVCAEDFMKINL